MDEHCFRLLTLGAPSDELCVLDAFVEGIEDEAWRVYTGDPLTPVYPGDAQLRSTREETGDTIVALASNTCSMLVVSGELKELIAQHAPEKVEYLPVTIFRKARVAAKGYFLVNPLTIVDCIDLKKSRTMYSKKDPTKVIEVGRWVLDRKKAKKAPQLFRMEHSRAEYVVGPALAEALRKARFPNVVLQKLPFNPGR